MIRKIGRTQLIGIVAILAAFFAAELAMRGIHGSPRQQAQAQSH
ncbi:MAG TPA: hypothetical protein VKY24_22920 [Reyranella sp.]|nr:hypothetical protein [Reyranella sp.]